VAVKVVMATGLRHLNSLQRPSHWGYRRWVAVRRLSPHHAGFVDNEPVLCVIRFSSRETRNMWGLSAVTGTKSCCQTCNNRPTLPKGFVDSIPLLYVTWFITIENRFFWVGFFFLFVLFFFCFNWLLTMANKLHVHPIFSQFERIERILICWIYPELSRILYFWCVLAQYKILY
jgi:hypothetical protein